MESNSKSDEGTPGMGPSGMRSRHRPFTSPAVGGSRNRPRGLYLKEGVKGMSPHVKCAGGKWYVAGYEFVGRA